MSEPEVDLDRAVARMRELAVIENDPDWNIAADRLEGIKAHTDSMCWCRPEVAWEDPLTGDRVYVHKNGIVA